MKRICKKLEKYYKKILILLPELVGIKFLLYFLISYNSPRFITRRTYARTYLGGYLVK